MSGAENTFHIHRTNMILLYSEKGEFHLFIYFPQYGYCSHDNSGCLKEKCRDAIDMPEIHNLSG